MCKLWKWAMTSPWAPMIFAALIGAWALAANGCTQNVRPFIELEGGYHFKKFSDPFYSFLADPPPRLNVGQGNLLGQPWVFRIKLGLEQDKFRWLPDKCGWEHESRLLDGAPFNNNAELYRETIVCSKKFGGF